MVEYLICRKFKNKAVFFGCFRENHTKESPGLNQSLLLFQESSNNALKKYKNSSSRVQEATSSHFFKWPFFGCFQKLLPGCHCLRFTKLRFKFYGPISELTAVIFTVEKLISRKKIYLNFR